MTSDHEATDQYGLLLFGANRLGIWFGGTLVFLLSFLVYGGLAFASSIAFTDIALIYPLFIWVSLSAFGGIIMVRSLRDGSLEDAIGEEGFTLSRLLYVLLLASLYVNLIIAVPIAALVVTGMGAEFTFAGFMLAFFYPIGDLLMMRRFGISPGGVALWLALFVSALAGILPSPDLDQIPLLRPPQNRVH